MRRLAVFIFIFCIFQETVAMAFFNPGKTCVFSAVRAQLTMRGEPVKNATIIRRWEWKDTKEDRTKTDDNGFFELPAVFESSITRMLPIEIVIGQELFVVLDDEEKKFWANAKRSADENSELKGRPISLKCELTDPMKVLGSFGLMQTLCSLEGQ